MSGPLPRFPTNALAPRIDHRRLATMNVHDLRRRIAYPPSTKRYEGNERVEAALKCLRDRVVDDEHLAIFAHCVSRDPRMSDRLRKFSFNAIYKSDYLIRLKKRDLEKTEKQWKEIDQDVRRLNEKLVGAGETNRLEMLQTLKRLANAYKDSSKRRMDAIIEWHSFGYNKSEFEQRLREDITVHTTFAVIKGINKMPLPNNIKRLVFQKTLEGSKLATKRTLRTHGLGNYDPNSSGSNWGGSPSPNTSPVSRSNGRRSPRSNGARTPRRNMSPASRSNGRRSPRSNGTRTPRRNASPASS